MAKKSQSKNLFMGDTNIQIIPCCPTLSTPDGNSYTSPMMTVLAYNELLSRGGKAEF